MGMTPTPTPPSCDSMLATKDHVSVSGLYISTVERFFMPSYPPMAHSLSMSATRATLLLVTFILLT